MNANSNYQINKNKYLLDDEYEHLLKVLDTFKLKDTRNCLLILLALNTGARATEILNIRYKDLNMFDESVLIYGIKNSNDREIPLESRLFKLLLSHLNISKKTSVNSELMNQKIFPISYVRFHQVWEQYRPCHKKLHSLRHTFAIRLYKKTKDIRLVQFALGHRNIANTMIYADYVYSQEELKKLLL